MKKCRFLDISTNSSSRVPSVLTSLTRHCCANNNKQWFLAKKIKLYLKFCIKKGCGVVKKFINEFPNRNQFPLSLNKLLTKLDQTGTVDCKPGSDKRCKTLIAENVDSELVLSQEYVLDIYKTGISKTSVHRIVKQE